MKKILMFSLIVALAAPVFAAADVTISIVDVGSGWAAIKYTATDCNAVAFGLNVSVNSSAKITGIRSYKTGESTAASRGYGIFPGTIAIDSTGNVTGWGTPIAPNTDPGATGTGLGTGTVVLELGALYDNDANKPLRTLSTLCELQVSGCSDMSVAVNATRCGKTGTGLDAGVVLDDATALVPTLPSATKIDYNCIDPRKCYTCLGDISGSGNNRVTIADLTALVTMLNNASAAGYKVYPTDSSWKECADTTQNSLISTADVSRLVTWLNNASGSGYSVYCSAATWTTP